MSRPTTRADLLAANDTSYARLHAALAALPDDVREDAATQWPIDDGSRNPRDVLAHLTAWHEMMLGWYAQGEAGARPAIPAPGHTWRTTPALNAQIHDAHLDWSYARALTAYERSRARCLALIRARTDEELFSKGRYAWTGTSTLGAYLVSATCSHDEWARKTLATIAKAARTGT